MGSVPIFDMVVQGLMDAGDDALCNNSVRAPWEPPSTPSFPTGGSEGDSGGDEGMPPPNIPEPSGKN